MIVVCEVLVSFIMYSKSIWFISLLDLSASWNALDDKRLLHFSTGFQVNVVETGAAQHLKTSIDKLQ